MDEPGPPLPPGWVVALSKSSGRTYWYNPLPNQATFVRGDVFTGAAAPASAVVRAPLPPPPPPPSASATSVAAAAVAASYANIPAGDIATRDTSRLLHLRNFNNWVKAMLMQRCSPHPATRVLDLACGKGGDLAKWARGGVRQYVGVDITAASVEEAVGRLCERNRGGGGRAVAAKFCVADLGVTDLGGLLFSPGEQFDVVSIQFALHYLFASEDRALTFFATVAGRLAPGGVLLGTIPDADVLVRRLRDLPGEGCAFGNDVYRVTFTPESKARTYALGGDPYGVGYKFWLEGAVGDVEEYLVPGVLLDRLAAAAGLERVEGAGFHEFADRCLGTEEGRTTAANMRVFDGGGSLRREEWEAAGLYRVFAYRKSGGAPVTLPPLSDLVPPRAGRGGGVPPEYTTTPTVRGIVVVE